MYRYGQPSRSNRSRYQQTILLLLVLALTITSIGFAIAYSDASRTNGTIREVLVSRIKAEVSQAKAGASQLMPTGGSQTEAMIATVRQHVYAARTVNEMATGLYGVGNALVNEALINSCVEKLDECDQKVQTGQVVTGTYSKLGVDIESLFSVVQSLQ